MTIPTRSCKGFVPRRAKVTATYSSGAGYRFQGVRSLAGLLGQCQAQIWILFQLDPGTPTA
jgi:hypothetical protein